MDKVFDVSGNEINPGDEIWYAMSLGRGAVLNRYKIIEMHETRNGGGYGAKPVIAATAECLQRTAGHVFTTKKSTLHACLFHERALKITAQATAQA